MDVPLHVLRFGSDGVDPVAQSIHVLAMASALQGHLHAVHTIVNRLDHALVRQEVVCDELLRIGHLVMDERARNLKLRHASVAVRLRGKGLNPGLDCFELLLHNNFDTLKLLLRRGFDLLDLLLGAARNVLEGLLDALVV